MQIGELSSATGLSRDTLRFYEKRGLLRAWTAGHGLPVCDHSPGRGRTTIRLNCIRLVTLAEPHCFCHGGDKNVAYRVFIRKVPANLAGRVPEQSRRGVATGYPVPEDWGWLIEYTLPDGPNFMIGCCSTCAPYQGYDGAPISWSVFVTERRSMKQRISNLSSQDELQTLARQILCALDDERISPAPAEA
jgi:hypothetical protein